MVTSILQMSSASPYPMALRAGNSLSSLAKLFCFIGHLAEIVEWQSVANRKKLASQHEYYDEYEYSYQGSYAASRHDVRTSTSTCIRTRAVLRLLFPREK